jgi:hypothetical protein
MGSSGDLNTRPAKLKNPPPAWVWKGLLAVGIIARGAAASEANHAARLAAIDSARTAAVETRRSDSSHLAAVVDSGPALSGERVMQVDWTLHQSPFSIPHDDLHRRATALLLDSTARVLRRASKNVSYAEAARALLMGMQAPLTATQIKRQSLLSEQLDKIDRRVMLETRRREARATAQTQPLQPRHREPMSQTPRTVVPSGASARCRDGSYSYSVSRRGTCSHHGGVSEWL